MNGFEMGKWGRRRGFGVWRLARVLSLFAVLLLVALSLCRAQPSTKETENLPPFRRLLLPVEQLPEEMKRVREGVLVRLPRAEFEALVEKAAAATARKVPPRLLEARYRAALKEEALVGEGQWKLLHKGPGPGLLNLEPFNLALRQARIDNEEAMIAAFDGKSPALLVETPGERSVSLEWSARAEAGPEGLLFHLEMPSCPVALLELDVPAERGVAVLTDGAFLSEAEAGASKGIRRWKIVCGGRRSIDVRIYPVERPAAEGAAMPFVRQKTTQKLHPEGLDAVFELTLDGLTHGVRELVCACDPELRLRDVAGPNVVGCSFQNGDDKNPARLTIRLREPMRAGTWQIRCLAPLNRSPSPGGTQPIAWRCPGLRLLNGVSRGETLSLWLHPEVRIESWDAGHFRLASSEIERTAGGQALTLYGGGLGPLRRPSARLQVHGVEFRTQERTWWRCDASGMALTVQIAWDVSQGQLFQLPLRLPPFWNVESVELNPSALLRDWRVRGPADKATLLVDLSEPLTARTSGDGERETRLPSLTVHLQPGWSGSFLDKKLPFPDAVPLQARIREGALALDCDEQLFQLDVSTSAERSEAETEGPWGKRFPEYYYRFKGHPPKGELRVRPRPPRLRVKCDTELSLASGRAALETRLLLEAESGSPDTIDLSLSANDGGAWSWSSEAAPRGEETSSNRVVRVERLYAEESSFAVHLLAARTPLQAIAAAAVRPHGERWRLTLARPLRPRETLRLHARRSLQPRDNRWEIPLPVVRGVERLEGEVRLYLERGDLVSLQTLGLRESVPSTNKGPTPWRTFRYAQSPVALTLSGSPPASARAAVAVLDGARLTTYAGTDAALRHHFAFQLANWNAHTLPLRLPTGSRPVAVRVDGRWLPRLLPRADDASIDEAQELVLPVPVRGDIPGDSVHRFEIVYTRPLPPGTWWQKLDAPMPELPLAPLSFRRIWRLSPQWTPLHGGRLQRVPGTQGEEDAALAQRFADLFHLPPSWRRFDPLEDEPQAASREALEYAVRQLCADRAEQTLPLRQVVSDLAFNYLKDRYILLIDAMALREAGIDPRTPISIERLSSAEAAPPWTACGLLAVPGQTAILLTTVCGRGAAWREPLSEDMENTLALAAAHGQDPSGRFRSALNWLHLESASAAVSPSPFEGEYERTDWSEWESIAGQGDEGPLVLHRDAATAAGLALVFLLAMVFWLLRRRSARRRWFLLLLLLGVLGLGAVWLPTGLRDTAWLPLLAASLGAGLWYLRGVVVRKRGGGKTAIARPKTMESALAGLLIFIIFHWSSRAEAPNAATVFLVPASEDSADKPTVLAPADLLERLKAPARPSSLLPGGARSVLLDAAYEGQIVEGQAEFAVVFSAYSPSDEASTLTLPLAEVQFVGEPLLDGVRVAPRALPAPQAGYAVRLRGRGRHKIELRFRAPILGTVEDRNVLFAVPSLPRSRLSWRIPAGAVASQVLVKYGAQWTTRDGGGERLEADLGALPRPVHLHWSQPSAAPIVAYQAAYLWQLGVEGNHLTATLRYQVRQGAVKTLQLDLPDDLEVGSASAQRTPSAAPLSWQMRFSLRDWQVRRIDGKRRLFLEFPCPLSGDLQVTLRLLPRGPLSAKASLPLPQPHGVRAVGSHYLATRTDVGLNAQRETSKYLTRIPAEEFAADWYKGPRLETTFAGIAYRITPDHFPQLVLHLEQTPPALESHVDLTVQTGSHLADMSAIVDLKAPNKDLALVEWELPSPDCTIAAVSGDDVRTWRQHGSHLLVWLQRTTGATRLHLSGWLPLRQGHLEWNGLHPRQSTKQHTRLRLTAIGALVFSELAVRNLQPIAAVGSSRRNSERETGFETDEASYHLRCTVRSAANAEARVLTLAEADERQLRFTATVNYRVTHGELRQLHLRLRHWPGDKVQLLAEGVAQPPTPRRTGNDRSWLVPLPPGITGTYRVTLQGSLPLDDAALEVRMPEVQVRGVEHSEAFLAVAGEWMGQASGALQALTAPRRELESSWPGAAERVERTRGQAWHVRGSDWQLRLQPRTQMAESAAVRVFLLEHSATVVDGRRWLHEARCWLRHEAHADLHLDFPAAPRLLAAAVDGVEVTPFALGSTRIGLPLPGRSGVRYLRLRWMYERPEPLAHPNLTPPLLADAVPGPTLWTVAVPAGWDANDGAPTTQLGSGAPREAALALYRAAAQRRIIEDLAKQRGDRALAAALADAQRRLALYCRHARHALAQGGARGNLQGPDGQSLHEWLMQLETAQQINKEKEVADSFTLSPCHLVTLSPSEGTPVSWQAPADGEPPRLQLTAHAQRELGQAIVASAAWLGGLAIVWVLSWLPSVSARLRLFWPEQIALLALLGWHLAGWTAIVLALFTAAAGGRVLLMVRGLRALLRRRRRQPSTMSAGVG